MWSILVNSSFLVISCVGNRANGATACWLRSGALVGHGVFSDGSHLLRWHVFRSPFEKVVADAILVLFIALDIAGQIRSRQRQGYEADDRVGQAEREEGCEGEQHPEGGHCVLARPEYSSVHFVCVAYKW